MKSLPKVTHVVVVDDYVLPATHMGLGIDNDIVAAYEDSVEARIVEVPLDNQVKRVRLEELERVIEETREAVRSFDATPD